MTGIFDIVVDKWNALKAIIAENRNAEEEDTEEPPRFPLIRRDFRRSEQCATLTTMYSIFQIEARRDPKLALSLRQRFDADDIEQAIVKPARNWMKQCKEAGHHPYASFFIAKGKYNIPFSIDVHDYSELNTQERLRAATIDNGDVVEVTFELYTGSTKEKNRCKHRIGIGRHYQKGVGYPRERTCYYFNTARRNPEYVTSCEKAISELHWHLKKHIHDTHRKVVIAHDTTREDATPKKSNQQK